MSDHQGNAAATVLIVSEHEEFTAAASRQLAANDYAVRVESPAEAAQTIGAKGCSPVAVVVDCDGKTADGSPLYGAARTAWPGCQIILICTLDQAPTGARLARCGEVGDYVLTDSVRDPHRLVLLIERAGAKVSTGQHDPAAQYQQVLQALGDMRELLKDGGKNPIARLLNGLKLDTSSNRLNGEPLAGPAAGYEDCLPEFIAGRLRRLENQILLWGGERLSVAAGLTSSRILVVEDDEISGELAKYILERHGFDVVVAKTAAAAKEVLKKSPPDLVLMDVHLGDANGLQLIKRLRSGSICPNVPVIVTTSDRMRETLLDAVDVNVQGYLLKPYQPGLLVQKVTAVLAASKGEPSEQAAPGGSGSGVQGSAFAS
jgi:DNA-binding response OmpR family regulator